MFSFCRLSPFVLLFELVMLHHGKFTHACYLGILVRLDQVWSLLVKPLEWTLVLGPRLGSCHVSCSLCWFQYFYFVTVI